MKRTYHALPFVILLLFGIFVYTPARQMTDTHTNGCIKVVDTENKRERCMAGNGITLLYKVTVNINSANTDATAITNLPAKFIVRKVTPTNPSTSLGISVATIGVYTGAGATGTNVVAAQLMTTLTGSTKFVDLPIALSADSLTASSLFVRCIAAHGSAATVDVYIEVTPLN